MKKIKETDILAFTTIIDGFPVTFEIALFKPLTNQLQLNEFKGLEPKLVFVSREINVYIDKYQVCLGGATNIKIEKNSLKPMNQIYNEYEEVYYGAQNVNRINNYINLLENREKTIEIHKQEKIKNIIETLEIYVPMHFKLNDPILDKYFMFSRGIFLYDKYTKKINFPIISILEYSYSSYFLIFPYLRISGKNRYDRFNEYIKSRYEFITEVTSIENILDIFINRQKEIEKEIQTIMDTFSYQKINDDF